MSPAIVVATDRLAGAVALAEVTDSQGASSAAVKDSVPPPVLVTPTDCAAGLAAPSVAVKASVDAASVSAGGALRVSVTGIVVVPPLELMLTSAVWLPAVKPAIAGVTVIVLPEVDSDNQAAVSLASNVSVPPPVLDTASVLAAGLVPPWTPLNDRAPGATSSTGGGDSTVSVTGIERGALSAPAASITISAW